MINLLKYQIGGYMSDTNKESKTKLQIAEAKKARLLEEAKKSAKRIEKLRAIERRNEATEKRNKDYRLKAHIGGMCEMTGLLRYVYPEGIESDNPQDRLIANLLVGAFQKLAYDLESMSVEELQELWSLGQSFRLQYKKDRELPKVNSNLTELSESIKDRIKSASATNQQSNGNVQVNESDETRNVSENNN